MRERVETDRRSYTIPCAWAGKCFVEYAEPEHSAKALAELQGRHFAERVVMCSYLDENKFANKDFS